MSDQANASKFFANRRVKMKLPFLPKIALAALLLASAGCVTPPPPPSGRVDLLAFLADGSTARSKVLSKLGQPSAAFEAEKILTYRLGFEPKSKGYWVVGRETDGSPWPVWISAKFSLVLVFNDKGVLLEHSLVNIRGGNP